MGEPCFEKLKTKLNTKYVRKPVFRLFLKKIENFNKNSDL